MVFVECCRISSSFLGPWRAISGRRWCFKGNELWRIENVRISYYLLYLSPTPAKPAGDVASDFGGFFQEDAFYLGFGLAWARIFVEVWCWMAKLIVKVISFCGLGLHWPRLGMKILGWRWVDLALEGPFLDHWPRRLSKTEKRFKRDASHLGLNPLLGPLIAKMDKKFLALTSLLFLRIFMSRFLIFLLEDCWPALWEESSKP